MWKLGVLYVGHDCMVWRLWKEKIYSLALSYWSEIYLAFEKYFLNGVLLLNATKWLRSIWLLKSMFSRSPLANHYFIYLWTMVRMYFAEVWSINWFIVSKFKMSIKIVQFLYSILYVYCVMVNSKQSTCSFVSSVAFCSYMQVSRLDMLK